MPIFNAVTKYRLCNMPFSTEDKALTNNLYPLKNTVRGGQWWNFRRQTAKKEEVDTLLQKKLPGTEAPTTGGRPQHARTEEKVTHCGYELVKPTKP